MTRGEPVFVAFVRPDGREVDERAADDAEDVIELRCAGPGWPWIDVDQRVWDSASAPVAGERKPRWVVRGSIRWD